MHRTFMERILYTVRDAATAMSISTDSVYDLCSTGLLERRYIGKGTRNFRIPAGSLLAYVESLPIDPLPT